MTVRSVLNSEDCRSCCIYSQITNPGTAEGHLAFAAFVALPAMDSLERRHASQGQIQGQTLKSFNHIPLVQLSKRGLYFHHMIEPAGKSRSELLKEIRSRVGKRVSAERSNPDAKYLMGTAPYSRQPYQQDIAARQEHGGIGLVRTGYAIGADAPVVAIHRAHRRSERRHRLHIGTIQGVQKDIERRTLR